MKSLYILVFTILIVNPILSQTDSSAEITSYYFIRHAEKDRSDSSNKDPHLNETGKIRANHWSSVFNTITFDAIYSTDYNRTRETAEPTALKNKLELQFYSPRDINLEEFLKETKGKTVLIVGHSYTTPFFANDIIGLKKYDQIEDNNNGNLYIVTIIDGKINDQLLLIN